MSMSKRDFVAVGRSLQGVDVPAEVLEKLCNAFQEINPAFKRGRWLDFVAGKVGPNGGEIREAR